MTEIPFWFHDRPKWVSGIGKQTTCLDILNALVKAYASKNSEEAKVDEKIQQLVLVEQWRGVERPLANSSKILKLWLAWGEERHQVRFVVKRITSTNTVNAYAASSLARTSRKTRRRNSRLSSASGRSGDTLHPSALSRTSDIEKLMRVILTQGETIHSQLKRLQEREGQIESFENEVHNSRTKTAGKDYLLNAYLDNLSDSDSNKKKGTSAESVPECLHEMVEALSKVHQLNEQLATTEETLSDLQSQVNEQKSSRSHSADGRLTESSSIDTEVSRLRTLNDRIGQEIDYNRDLIHSMKTTFIERKALVSRLEEDMGHTEIEGQRLEVELKRVMSDNEIWMSQFEQELRLPPNYEADDDEEDLLKDILASKEAKFQLTSSQLYEKSPDRINATGSPGSSSGNSTSGCGTGSEKSVRFCDRDTIMATPDLPPLPPGDYPGQKSNVAYTKSILKSVDPSGDLDSNSDTGLSSLHSSSDEGTYVLDTLV